MSPKDPRLQNIPIRTELGKNIREAFATLKSDHVDVDYSSIEMRIFEAIQKSAVNPPNPTGEPTMKLVVMQRGASAHLPLIGRTPAEETLKELVAFAEKKENWFKDPNESAEAAKTRTDPRPEGGSHAPCSRHITVNDAMGGEVTYHVSFTITIGQIAPSLPNGMPDFAKAKDAMFRHATIGVGDFERLADPIEAFTILKFLGFKTLEPRMTRHPDFNAMVFFEPMTPEDEAAIKRANMGLVSES